MKKKLLIIFILVLVFVSGCSIKREEDLSDSEMFAKEYAVSKDNPFKYATIEEVLDIIDSGNGIIFFGTSDSEISAMTVKIFLEATLEFKDEDIDVYYYNPIKIRDDNTLEYNRLVSELNNHLDFNEKGEEYLYLPAIYFIKNGNVVADNNDTAFMKKNIDEKKTIEFEKNLKNRYVNLLKIYLKEDTDTDNI